MVCIMAAVMLMSLGCHKDSISPIIPDGVLPGSFSVSATQQVHFSQGNLQYQARTNTWRFAEHQYDYVGTQTAAYEGASHGGNVSGSDNRNISSTYSGWIDLFGWGTGDNPTLSSDNYGAYGTFVDWGSNPISNGGNTANRWRTLTQAEWEYLLKLYFPTIGHCRLRGVRSFVAFHRVTVTGHVTATLFPSGRRWRLLVRFSCLRRATATARRSPFWAATIGCPRPKMRSTRTAFSSTATISTRRTTAIAASGSLFAPFSGQLIIKTLNLVAGSLRCPQLKIGPYCRGRGFLLSQIVY